MDFEFINDTNRLKIKAFGKNITELFFNAALGMMTFMYPEDIASRDYETKEKIRIRAGDQKSLLVDWLTELLYFSNTKKVCYNNFYFETLAENQLSITAYGRRAGLKESIKLVALKDLQINQTKNGLEALIEFDI